MLLQNEQFINNVFNRLVEATGTSTIPMDAYRRDSDVWVHLDVPGIASESIDVTVERNVLTVTGERTVQRQDGDQVYVSDRRSGPFKRQVHLGESLDTENIEADYQDGVLTLRIPVAEKAKPKKVKVNIGNNIVESPVKDVIAGD